MSSPLFVVRVHAVEGRDVVLDIKPTTASGLCNLPRTRSFVLMEYCRQGGTDVTFEQSTDRSWLPSNLDAFVTSVRIESGHGFAREELLEKTCSRFQIPVEHLQPRIKMRATMATEARARCFPVGEAAETTSYDVWYEGRLAELPHFDTTPFDPAAFGERSRECEEVILPALQPLLPRFIHTPVRHLHRAEPDVDLRLSFHWADPFYRPGFTVCVSLDVLAFCEMGRRGESPTAVLLQGTLRPRGFRHWVRQYEGLDDGPPPLAHLDEVKLEAPRVTFERLAAALNDPAVDGLLTRTGVIGLFEDVLAAQPPKALPANLERLGAGRAPPLPPTWHWEWETVCLWRRVLLHAALGRREDAQAALAQARAKSKKPPKELKTLMAALDAEAQPVNV